RGRLLAIRASPMDPPRFSFWGPPFGRIPGGATQGQLRWYDHCAMVARLGEPPAEEASVRAWVFEAVAELSDALVVVDEHARLVYANPAAERLVGLKGLSENPETWSTDYGIFHPDERTLYPPLELPLARALRGIEVRDVGLFVRNPAVPNGVHILVNS